MISDSNFERAKSVVAINTVSAIELISTIHVESTSSFLVGQETFFNSTDTSVKNVWIFVR